MSSLCYPYGSGITCVCDDGRIYKCFPDLKSHTASPGAEPDLQLPHVDTENLQLYSLDRSTEIVLASTFLILVILIFLAFLVHRCEKTFRGRSRVQGEITDQHQCKKEHHTSRIPSTSVSIQTEPQLWGMKKAATSKSLLPYQLEDGERTFYGITNSEVKKASSQSYDQLLQSLTVQTPEEQGQMTEDSDSAETQRMMDSGSGCGEGEVVEDTEATVLAL